MGINISKIYGGSERDYIINGDSRRKHTICLYADLLIRYCKEKRKDEYLRPVTAVDIEDFAISEHGLNIEAESVTQSH